MPRWCRDDGGRNHGPGDHRLHARVRRRPLPGLVAGHPPIVPRRGAGPGTGPRRRPGLDGQSWSETGTSGWPPRWRRRALVTDRGALLPWRLRVPVRLTLAVADCDDGVRVLRPHGRLGGMAARARPAVAALLHPVVRGRAGPARTDQFPRLAPLLHPARAGLGEGRDAASSCARPPPDSPSIGGQDADSRSFGRQDASIRAPGACKMRRLALLGVQDAPTRPGLSPRRPSCRAAR